MKKNGFEDKRLLEAIDRIDSKYISEMLEYYDDLPAEGAASKRLRGKKLRYVVSLAACIVLLATVIPVANYIATRVIGVTPGGNPGGNPSATSDILSNDTESESADLEWEHPPVEPEEDYNYPVPECGLNFIEHVGEVPEEFKKIVENNLFLHAELIGDELIRHVRTKDETIFYFFDKWGNVIRKAKYPNDPEKTIYVSNYFLDSEGNLLVCFETSGKNSGVKIVKFDTEGKLIFAVDLPEKTYDFYHMIETDDGYIFAGRISEKDQQRNRWTSDVLIAKLTRDGNIENTISIGTSGEYDSVCAAAESPEGATLYLCLQETKEGETRATWNYFRYEIGKDLTVLKQTPITEDDVPEYEHFFIINGKKFDDISDFINGHDRKYTFGGELIEYDDFVLLVGDRYTSNCEPMNILVSSLILPEMFYRETVYAAYTKDGELIWRTAVDSTDYSALKTFFNTNE